MRRPNDRDTAASDAMRAPKAHHPIDHPDLSPEELAVALSFTPAPWWFKIFDGLWLAFYAYCFYTLATGPHIYRGSPQLTKGNILLGTCLLGLLLISAGQYTYAKRSGDPRMRPIELYRAIGFSFALIFLNAAVMPGRRG